MQKELASLKAKKIQVVGLSYDSVEVLAKFASHNNITYSLLSDPDSVTIKDFQLMNTEAGGKATGVPYPGIMILDKHGTIRAKLFYEGYRKRHTPSDILDAVAAFK